jgi:hypothetical protein
MIVNAKDKKIGETADLPDVSAAVNNFLQKITINTITKENVDGRIQETLKQNIEIMAAKQPYKPQEKDIREEGYRSWRWFRIDVDRDLGLKLDDIIILKNIQYRVMSSFDASEYGFITYIVCEGYQS